jgi:hypothetical protein
LSIEEKCGEVWRSVEKCGEVWRSVEKCGEVEAKCGDALHVASPHLGEDRQRKKLKEMTAAMDYG